MTPLDSSSSSVEAESTTFTTMDNLSNTTSTTNRNCSNKHRRNNKNSHRNSEEDQEAGGDPQAWRSLNTSFKQVQSVLDRNRVLIQQVNDNHQSKNPDNMVKNVALIQEINGNISKVVSLYSDMSTNLSSTFHEGSKNSDGD